MTFDLKGKVGLVTGATRGLGRFFSWTLTEAGADIVCADKDPPEETGTHIQQLGRRSLALIVDVSKPEDIESVAKG
jgi:NAD(P)-dependent dehydrogenase (short-subunit alcohol dehydrogenase family)